MIEKSSEPIITSEYICIVLVIFLVSWNIKRNLEFTKRITRSRTKSNSVDIDQQKIIIALEIENLFFKYSNKKQHGYMELQLEAEEYKLLKKLKSLLGYGNFYCLLQPKNKIRAFLKSLNSLSSVQLYLYTSLKKPFAEKILRILQIENYFPTSNRRYCEEEDNINYQKHPSWVDANTRRVMIVTANEDDYDGQDKRYFLVLKSLKSRRMLRSALHIIRHIIQKVDCIDNLHGEMDEVKAQIESDYQNQEIIGYQ